jgi:hypothetical protein
MFDPFFATLIKAHLLKEANTLTRNEKEQPLPKFLKYTILFNFFI